MEREKMLKIMTLLKSLGVPQGSDLWVRTLMDRDNEIEPTTWVEGKGEYMVLTEEERYDSLVEEYRIALLELDKGIIKKVTGLPIETLEVFLKPDDFPDRYRGFVALLDSMDCFEKFADYALDHDLSGTMLGNYDGFEHRLAPIKALDIDKPVVYYAYRIE